MYWCIMYNVCVLKFTFSKSCFNFSLCINLMNVKKKVLGYFQYFSRRIINCYKKLNSRLLTICMSVFVVLYTVQPELEFNIFFSCKGL